MKARRKAKSAVPCGVKIVRRSVATTILVQFDTLEELEEIGTSDVEGAIVKVAPKLTASERDKLDANIVASRIRELGAVAVVVSPIIIPDAAERPRQLSKKLQPREMVEAWLGELIIEDDVRSSVRDAVFGFMDAEGM